MYLSQILLQLSQLTQDFLLSQGAQLVTFNHLFLFLILYYIILFYNAQTYPTIYLVLKWRNMLFSKHCYRGQVENIERLAPLRVVREKQVIEKTEKTVT